MKKPYSPPFKITPAMVSRVADISVALGRLAANEERASSLRLRRASRIRTIQGSLAIEGNTLGTEQITAILEGKRVLAPRREVQEVRNAIAAYDFFDQWQPHRQKDLLAAHQMLMTGLLDGAGRWRKSGVGVMSGEVVIHMAPPANMLPKLMSDLFEWLRTTEQHPLIASSVFHYEFEFIHPFDDGNGRVGRLWQTLILSRWHPLFAHIPVESLVYEHQSEYYAAINACNESSDASPFIVFMLDMILVAVKSMVTPEVGPEVTPEVERLLSVMSGEMTRREMQVLLGLNDEKNFRQRYLLPALSAGVVEMTVPDKPKSRLQKYRRVSL